uniref:DDE-1 domain-containing protein n=1 Tax=Bombyx mori TaxID=7091 RepID=A0A8R2M6P9_BOMMO|nr:uncharacterized protein LOC119630499 [Bombyx mori]
MVRFYQVTSCIKLFTYMILGQKMDKWRYNRTTSSWFDSNAFEDWVDSVALPYFEDKPGKKMLIGDNLSSHLSINLICKCKEKDIYFVFLPANSTHLTQPLDVAFFRPMKTAWRDILFHWKKSDGRSQSSVPKNCFPQLLKKLFQRIEKYQKNNIIAGFAKTGISPLNKEKVLEKLPGNNIRNETSIEDEKKAIDEKVLKLLSDMHYGKESTGNIKYIMKKQKINLQAGKSVSEDSGYADLDLSASSSMVSGNISSDKVGDKEISIETKSLNVKVKRKQKYKVNGGRDIGLLEDDSEKETDRETNGKDN